MCFCVYFQILTAWIHVWNISRNLACPCHIQTHVHILQDFSKPKEEEKQGAHLATQIGFLLWLSPSQAECLRRMRLHLSPGLTRHLHLPPPFPQPPTIIPSCAQAWILTRWVGCEVPCVIPSPFTTIVHLTSDCKKWPVVPAGLDPGPQGSPLEWGMGSCHHASSQ